MKNFFLFIVAIFLTGFLYSQEKGIRISNSETNETTFIQENKRIRIKVDGKKISGRFEIIDDKTILVKDEPILLDRIEKIKKNPLALNIAVDFVFALIGAYSILVGIVVIAVGSISEYAALGVILGSSLIIPGSFMLYGAIKSPNFLRGYSEERSWNYSISGL